MSRLRLPGLAIAVLVVQPGCMEQTGSEHGLLPESLTDNSGHTIPLSEKLSSTRSLDSSGIRGNVRVDGGSFRAMTLENGQASTRIDSLSSGAHAFTLEFNYQTSEFGDVTLAKGQKTLTVQANRSNVTIHSPRKESHIEFSPNPDQAAATA